VSPAPERRTINPWRWQEAFAFVQATEVRGAHRVLYCAGQASVDADGRGVHPGDMRGQVGQALTNLETVLGAAGLTLADVVRLNYYTTDVDALLAAWDAVSTRLQQARCHAASTLLGVTRLAAPDLLVEIEATAVA
jgi:enamine deaminase RidA (YjgF/YER057c/UK114 family)